MYYDDDQMLMLSGIQHYMFCPRQWALIHVEQQWADNRLTAEGEILHKNVDDPTYRQKNGDTITLRAVHVASHALGLYGICDAIELLPSETKENAITHPKYSGYWSLYPVEYKRGHKKPDERDAVQLAAQVMCLEEMYDIQVTEAALFYYETHRREVVVMDEPLRQLTIELSEAMHKTFDSGITPKAMPRHNCKSCSLYDVCTPEITKKTTVAYYLKKSFNEEIA